MGKVILCYTNGNLYQNATVAANDMGISPDRLRYALNHGKLWIDGTCWGYIENIYQVADFIEETKDEVKVIPWMAVQDETNEEVK